MKNYTPSAPRKASLPFHQRKKITVIRHVLACLMFLVSVHSQAQYLHTSGKMIVDKNNQEVILRGMGLGGWMLQEGYMLETNSFANPQHQIRNKIRELIGEE